ncbi:hypothetical protein K456DRAFT_1333453 [Colletotrichum gloeosporioides 23]|nr:hypothetical protein K456DRAFT_1333453 [Colletotrichum gloeosporioides 23]
MRSFIACSSPLTACSSFLTVCSSAVTTRSSASMFLFHVSDFFHASNMILTAACSSLVCLAIVRSSGVSPSWAGFARSLSRVAARVVAGRPPPAVSVARSIAFSVISWYVWFRRAFADGFAPFVMAGPRRTLPPPPSQR